MDSVRAARVALATNAFPPLLKRLSYYVVPVYDYALVTEPLTRPRNANPLDGMGGKASATRAGNSITRALQQMDVSCGADTMRSIIGIMAFGPHLEKDPASFARLAEHFFQAFPQLEGIHFTHAWGGAIDTCSRFSPFWGTAHHGKTAYAMGYTGLGVGASRFGARVILDILDGCKTERTA